MLICEILIVLVLFDVAAGIEISSDRQSGEWTPRYWGAVDGGHRGRRLWPLRSVGEP